MSLPVCSSKQVFKALMRAGFKNVGGTKGHIRMKKHDSESDTAKITVVPINKKEIAKGTLRAIIRKAGLTREEFLELLN